MKGTYVIYIQHIHTYLTYMQYIYTYVHTGTYTHAHVHIHTHTQMQLSAYMYVLHTACDTPYAYTVHTCVHNIMYCGIIIIIYTY